MDDQPGIASAYYQLGSIYSDWGKYQQAINYYQQSKEIYQKLDKHQNVARILSWLASCYQDLKDYQKAIEYCQESLTLHQQLNQQQTIARSYWQIAESQISLAKNTSNQAEISELLTKAEENTIKR